MRARLHQLQLSVPEFAGRVGVNPQTVRHWLNGRSFPGKSKVALVDSVLGCRIDYAEGATSHAPDIAQLMSGEDLDLFLTLRQLPVDTKTAMHQLARSLVANMASKGLVTQKAPGPFLEKNGVSRKKEISEPVARRRAGGR
jgi:transcriptional regulator with XRE-family HTH domain